VWEKEKTVEMFSSVGFGARFNGCGTLSFLVDFGADTSDLLARILAHALSTA
jgi:hypothetical protein